MNYCVMLNVIISGYTFLLATLYTVVNATTTVLQYTGIVVTQVGKYYLLFCHL